MWYYTYVLYDDKTKKFYIGFTGNLKRRFNEHKGNFVHTTKRYRNQQLIFFEAFKYKKDAMRRERFFKTTNGKKTLKLMLREFLTDRKGTES